MMTQADYKDQVMMILAVAFCLLCLMGGGLSDKSFQQTTRAPSEHVVTQKAPEKSSFRHQAISKQQPTSASATTTTTASTSQSQQRGLPAARKEFRIGVIVPRTAFLSQYKTYTQRIKDTFNQMLQLSRHQQVKRKQTVPSSPSASSQFPFHVGGAGASSAAISLAASTTANGPTSASPPSIQLSIQDNKLPSSSCLSNSRALPSSSSSHHHHNHQQRQHHKQWIPLIFNQYFDIKVVDLVNLTARSSVREIIDSMCRGLIEQNVSVIVYLENNQDQPVSSSLDSAPSTVHALSSLEPFQMSLQRAQIENSSAPASEPRHQPQQSEKISPQADGFSLRAGRWSSSEVQQASSQAHFIMHLAHSAGIPMIAWSVTATLAQRPKKQRTLHLAPTVAHEAKAMLAILERYSWHSFSVVSTTLAGHDDFILALRQLMATSNSSPQQQQQQQNLSSSPVQTSSSTIQAPDLGQQRQEPLLSDSSHFVPRQQQQQQQEQISAQPSRTFKLVDVITIKKSTLAHIEQELRQLTVSESRVILLYATKGEAIDILKVANRLRLTKRSYAWIVAQSVIGSTENELAPAEFHPGLLGIYFRSNHERLLDELSRAITIIAHGLERLVRDRNITVPDGLSAGVSAMDGSISSADTISERDGADGDYDATSGEKMNHEQQQHRAKQHKLLASHSKCYGPMEELSERRADLLYEYFRKSSPFNVFDADGSLKDVELSVVNLDNERQWHKIGCFSDAKLTIDDITWPEQAERPPSGTMEKFHLRAVFLEEPSFVNLAEPDAETNECKTNRAVKCRYKVLNNSSSSSSSNLTPNQAAAIISIGNSAGGRESASRKASALNQTQDDYEFRCCSGFCIDLMEKFAADLKFSYDLYRVPDGYWGILENDTWNGLIGEIVRGEADVIVGSVKINSDRQKAVDFTVPFLDTGISIIVAKQTGVIAKLAFLEPFDTLAWIMFICVGIPLAATSIFLFEWLSPGGFYAGCRGSPFAARPRAETADESQPLTTREAHKFSFCRTLWLVITILFGSAAHIDSPKGYTARFMSNVWATFAVVFLAVYTANLAAFMITREEYLELSGIGDSKLAYPYHRHPPLKFGTITGGNTHAVLSANKPNLYSHMKRYNRASVEEGVDAVKSGQLDAFVYDALVLDYMASQDPECRLVNVGAWYSMTGYAMAFPRNSRYFEKFDMKMLEYRKNGELDRLRRFWLQGQCKPGQSRHSISKPLDLSQFMSAFLLLGAGILCSVFVLLLEHLYVMFLRERLLKSRHRKKLMSILYPFSLSLTDTLRLAEDDDSQQDGQHRMQNELQLDCYKHTGLNAHKQVARVPNERGSHVAKINHRSEGRAIDGLADLIRAFNEDERISSLLMRLRRYENKAEPACIEEFRLVRLRSVLKQLEQLVLEDEEEDETTAFYESSSQNCCPSASFSRLSIDDVAVDNSVRKRKSGQAQISRRIWRHTNNNDDDSRKRSISLASGLDGRESRPDSFGLSDKNSSNEEDNRAKKRTIKQAKLDPAKESDQEDGEQFAASRMASGNKETLL